MRTLLTAGLLVCLASQGAAACRIQVGGTRCVEADALHSTPRAKHFKKAKGVVGLPDSPSLNPGDVLPEGVTVLFNRKRYDLPAPTDGWTYFRVGQEIFRADLFTRKVIDRVNDHVSIRY